MYLLWPFLLVFILLKWRNRFQRLLLCSPKETQSSWLKQDTTQLPHCYLLCGSLTQDNLAMRWREQRKCVSGVTVHTVHIWVVTGWTSMTCVDGDDSPLKKVENMKSKIFLKYFSFYFFMCILTVHIYEFSIIFLYMHITCPEQIQPLPPSFPISENP